MADRLIGALETGYRLTVEDPEQARRARGAELSLRSGLDPDTALELEPELTQPVPDWRAFREEAPTTAQMLAGDGRIMTVAAPFVADLWRQEKRLRAWKVRRPGEGLAQDRLHALTATLGSVYMGLKDVGRGLSTLHRDTVEQVQHTLREAGPDALEALDEETRQVLQDIDGVDTGAIGDVLPTFEWMKTFEQDVAGAGTGLRFVSNVFRALPTTGAALIGGLVGGVPGAAAVGGSLVYGQSLDRYRNDPAVTATDNDLRLYALGNALVQGGLEAVGARGLAGALRGFRPAGSWGKALKGWAEGMVREGLTEGAQEFPDRFFAELARGADLTDMDDVRGLLEVFTSSDFWEDAGYAALVGGAAGGLTSAPGLRTQRRAFAAQEAALAALPDMARKAPAAYRALLRAHKEAGTVDANVFIPAAAVQGLFQDEDIAQDRAEFLARAGIDARDFEAALDSGGTVAVPFERIADVLHDERGKALADHLSFSPEQESAAAEVTLRLQEALSAGEAEVEAAPDDIAALNRVREELDDLAVDERAVLRQGVVDALVQATAGNARAYTASEARAYADIIDAVTHTFAATHGLTYRGAFHRIAPEFVRPDISAEEFEAVTQQVRETARLPEAVEQDAMLAVNRGKPDRVPAAPRLSLAERAPLLALVRGRLDAKSLKQDFPEVYRELLQTHGRGLFRSRDKGGLAVDLLADEAKNAGLLPPDADASTLVEKLRAGSRELFHAEAEPQSPDGAFASGTAAMDKVLREQTDVLNAMYRSDVGGISFYWGTPGTGPKLKKGYGLSHLIARRNAEGQDGKAVAQKMPEVLAYGHISRRQNAPGGDRVFISHDNHTAVLSLYRFGNRETWLVTGWLDDNSPDVQAEVYDSESTTHTEATRFHSGEGAGKFEEMIQPLGADGKPLFHDAAPTPRASYLPVVEAKGIIRFFESADISSAGHEIGHVLRRVLELGANMDNAPDFVRRDWDTACAFVGAEPGAVWTTAQEETFADAFLDYLHKGKAPSTGLRRAFTRLARWLTGLYRRIRRAGVRVSPQMKQVFDRLLATEQDLNRARQKNGLTHLASGLEDLPADWLGGDEAKALAEAAAQADLDAEAAIHAKMASELRRERARWRKEAKAFADTDPEQVHLDELIAAGGLSLTGELRARYGDDLIRAVQGKRPGAAVFAKEEAAGLDPAEAADMWGFVGPSAVDDFMSRLAELPTRKALQERYLRNAFEIWRNSWSADEVMLTDGLERLLDLEEVVLAGAAGSAFQDGEAVRRSAIEAVHQLEVGQLERNLEALKTAARENGEALRLLYRTRLAGQRDRLKEQARKQLDAVRDRYREKTAALRERLETRADERLEAVRERFRTALENKEELALELKRRQRRALAEIRARYEARELRRKGTAFIQRVTRAKPGVVDYVWLEQMRSVAQRFGLGGRRGAVRTPERLESLPAFLTRIQAEFDAPIPVPEWLLSVPAQGVSLRRLSVAQFSELVDFIKWMDHQGRTAKRVELEGRARDLDQALTEMGQSIASLKSKTAIADYEKKRIGLKAVQHLGRTYLADITQFEYVFKAADGFRRGASEMDGPFVRHLIRPLYEARSAEMGLLHEMRLALDEILTPFRTGAGAARGRKREAMPDVPLPERVQRRWGALPWTYERRLMVALNMGNEGNLKALKQGFGWNDEHLARITADLSAEDWSMVQRIWDCIETLYPHLDAAYQKVNGLPMKKVQARRVQTPHGLLRGGYFPLVFDQALSEKAADHRETDALMNGAAALVRAVKPSDGFTKERGGSTLPPLLSLSVLNRHIQDACHYATHAPVIHDIRKITRNTAWRDALEDKFGEGVLAALQPWLNNIARPQRQDLTGVERFVEWGRHMATIQALGLKFSTSVMQFTGLSASAQEIGWKAVAEGLSFIGRHRTKAYETIRALSPMMRDRARTVNADLARNLDRLNPDRRALVWELGGKTYEVTWNDVQAAAFAPLTFCDSIVAYATWWGAYQKALRESGGDEQRAVTHADRAVALAQSSGNAANLSVMQQATGFKKLLTMFMTYTMNLQNRIRFQTRGLVEKRITPVQYVGFMFHEVLLPAVAGLLFKALTAGGEVPDDPAEYMKEVGYYLLSGFPVIRDVQSVYEYGGDIGIVNSSVSRGLGAPFRAGRSAYAWWTADNDREADKALFRFVRDSIDAAGFAAGVPTRPVYQFFRGAADLIDGKTENPLALFVKQEG